LATGAWATRARAQAGFGAPGTAAHLAVYSLRLTVEGRPLEDVELIARAQSGEVMAYEELVRRYQDVAVRTAHIVSPDGDAEDAAQDAFVKAYAALSRFRREAPFRPWLLRIVANEARNRRRSAGRRAGLAIRVVEDRRPDDAAPSPESAVLAGEARATLLAAVNALRDDDREIIGARYFLELSEAETAEALGIPRGTVKSRLSRALARLREQLVAADGEPTRG
jgi:RNA polymerase sigma factor (sigma-70 family)